MFALVLQKWKPQTQKEDWKSDRQHQDTSRTKKTPKNAWAGHMDGWDSQLKSIRKSIFKTLHVFAQTLQSRWIIKNVIQFNLMSTVKFIKYVAKLTMLASMLVVLELSMHLGQGCQTPRPDLALRAMWSSSQGSWKGCKFEAWTHSWNLGHLSEVVL